MKERPSRSKLKKLYKTQGLTLREIATRLDVHFDTVRRWIEDYGIELRTRTRRSSLERFKLSTLENGVRKYGVRGFARKLKIHEETLRKYLKKAREG